MPLDDVRLLIVRSADLLLVSVRLVGFESGGDGVVSASGGIVEFTLPPQATGETIYDEASGTANARTGGTSRVSFRVAPGSTAALTAEEILTMAASGTPITDAAPPGQEPISVELPWRIRFAPRPAAAQDTLLASFPITQLPGASGACGLWQLRIEAASGLALVPLDVDDDDITPPLDRGKRDRIVAEGSPPADPPTAPYLDLGALGGSMSAKGTWPTFAWEQHTVLGRDMMVRTESSGFLYPWGHRAVLVNVTTRVPTPSTGSATAALQNVTYLVVPDPVRRPSAVGELARALPFDEIEVLQPVSPVGEEEIAERFRRVPKRLDELDGQSAAKQQSLTDQEAAVAAAFTSRRAEIDAAAQSARDTINTRLSEIGPIIDDVTSREAAFQDWAAHQPVDPPRPPPHFIGEDEGAVIDATPPPPVDPGPTRPSPDEFAQLAQLQVEANALNHQLDQIESSRQAYQNGLNTEDDLAAAGESYASTVALARQLRIEVPAFTAFVQGIREQADQQHTVYEWPHAPAGPRLQLPIRCDGLTLSTPALFVHDIHLADNDDFPEFAPLTDETVLAKIITAWQAEDGHRLPVPGIAVDLVRTGQSPQPLDVLPVYELTIEGRSDAGQFRAVIAEAKVALIAVGRLVPNVDGLTRVDFDPAYLSSGIADKVALRIQDGLDVDFRQAADKAGGLISPTFTADVLSRMDGPVDARALPGLRPGPPDLAAAFADATILGIPLASVVDNASLPKPLSIVAGSDGQPLMTWKGLQLKSHGPLVVTPGQTTFTLSVTASNTTCRIERFALVLPPGGDLVRLNFAALTFVQKLGEAPSLNIQGFRFELGGDLSLLKTLEEQVDFGSAAPAVHPTPNGIRASYSLAVPEVTAGVFVLSNIAAEVAVELPFDGSPIVTTLSFATRDDPFTLTVSFLGGGGYLQFEIADAEIRALEASLDFGAAVAIGIGVATAEVHALGGVRMRVAGSDVSITGFIRIGGSVDVLGLVWVSVDLMVELSYDGHALRGRAFAVIEIDVTFWSGSIELDSGEYTFAGAVNAVDAPTAAAITSHEPTLDDWQQYRNRFGGAA